jgi:hypothetical protein
MSSLIHKWFTIKYPQNYIIKNPLQGAFIIALFCFGFVNLYKPLDFHASRVFSYEVTMAFYSCIGGVTVFLFAKILKSFRFFSNLQDWIVIKEILSVLLILVGLGVIIFLIGQLIEPVGHRSKIATLLNSCKYGFLVGIMPFTFFSAMNYRYLFPQHDDEYVPIPSQGSAPPEALIIINSQLKKEELKFYPSEFLYAESDGNYVVFYLNKNELIKKEVIRNSINNIEQQLSEIPYFLRIHRAFIVNLKKVRSKHGNTLGYQIKLSGIDSKIPVSRSNTGSFNKLFAQYYK